MAVSVYYSGGEVPDIMSPGGIRRTPPGPQRTVCLPDEYYPELTIKEVINEQHHMGPAAGISRRAWEHVWCRRATGCTIWLTGPVSPVSLVMPNV